MKTRYGKMLFDLNMIWTYWYSRMYLHNVFPERMSITYMCGVWMHLHVYNFIYELWEDVLADLSTTANTAMKPQTYLYIYIYIYKNLRAMWGFPCSDNATDQRYPALLIFILCTLAFLASATVFIRQLSSISESESSDLTNHGPKLTPRWTKIVPIWSEDGERWLLWPRTPWPQLTTMRPKWAKMAPIKINSRWLKLVPRWGKMAKMS